MSSDLETIQKLARGSLMPDFFGVRVDEEGLWSALSQALGGVQPATPNPTVERIRGFAREATTASGFIEQIKAANLWNPLRDLLARLKAK
jgi:hypothetical protein